MMPKKLLFPLLGLFILIFLAGCQPAAATATKNAQLEAGRQALDNKAYDLALQKLNAAAISDPGNYEVYYLRGMAYYGRYQVAYDAKDPKADPNDFWRAVTDFTKAIELNHEHAESYDFRALTYHGLGLDEHALADYNQALVINPGLEYAYYGRGLVYEESGRTAEAIADYSAFLELSQDDYWRGEAQKRLAALKGTTP
jgi:tetratricopeptide (TPR) repeat protein